MNSDIQYPVEKAASAWAAWGITTWADASSFASTIAAVLAALYTMTLMGEWWWKKAWRPFLVRRGLLKPLPVKANEYAADE